MKSLVILTLSLLLTVSCSFVPLKQKPLDKDKIPDSFENSASLMVERDSLVVTEWWKKYKDDQLNETIEKMLVNNLDLKLALSRLDMLESQQKAARGSRLPSVAANPMLIRKQTEKYLCQLVLQKIQQLQTTLQD